MTNDPLQLPMEINLLETVQQAQYPALPTERHVAVISIPHQAQTWWIITIKLQWISCQRDSREGKVRDGATFSSAAVLGRRVDLGFGFWFSPPPQENKKS